MADTNYRAVSPPLEVAGWPTNAVSRCQCRIRVVSSSGYVLWCLVVSVIPIANCIGHVDHFTYLVEVAFPT